MTPADARFPAPSPPFTAAVGVIAPHGTAPGHVKGLTGAEAAVTAGVEFTGVIGVVGGATSGVEGGGNVRYSGGLSAGGGPKYKLEEALNRGLSGQEALPCRACCGSSDLCSAVSLNAKHKHDLACHVHCLLGKHKHQQLQ